MTLAHNGMPDGRWLVVDGQTGPVLVGPYSERLSGELLSTGIARVAADRRALAARPVRLPRSAAGMA
jgi:hypothetical protein